MARTDQRVGKILKHIAKPHTPARDDNGKYDINNSQKVCAIKDLLDEIGFDTIVDEKYGVLAYDKSIDKTNIEETIQTNLKKISLLVISHIDNIKIFNTTEIQENLPKQLLAIQGYEEYDEKITGALDNTMTNAILLSIMQMRKVNFSDECSEVMFFFSIGDDEDERGFDECSGVENFMKDFHKNLIENNTKVLNLDITAQEYHNYKDDSEAALFIEYDKTLKEEKVRVDEKYSSLGSLTLFDDISSDIQFCDYGEEGTSDDLEDVTKYNIWGVTVALNTYGEIHSKKNYTYMKHIDKYFNFLHNLILFLK